MNGILALVVKSLGGYFKFGGICMYFISIYVIWIQVKLFGWPLGNA